MTISSRTPEGQPNQCPLCGASVQIEPSQPSGDAPCPACGHLLWFHRRDDGLYVLDHADVEAFAERIAAVFGLDPVQLLTAETFLDDMGADSLDTVELLMDLEEEFELVVPDSERDSIRTVQDMILAVARFGRRKKREDE